MAEKRPALGRGLSALIPDAPASEPALQPSAPPAPRGVPLEVDLDRIVPNPRQPRLQMEQGPLEELAQSIRSNGIIQPILVRRSGDQFEIIAGERRWRAAQIAGLLRAPVIVREIADDQLLQVALIENIQRENLNPIDEATAYRRLLDECAMTQEALADAVGKDRASIANHLRLLRLPGDVQRQVSAGALSMGHARALVALENPVTLKKAADDVVARGLSVRETEALVRRLNAPPAQAAVAVKDVHTREAEDVLKLALGTRVRIVRKGKGGKVEIDFVSEDELNRIYEHITDKRDGRGQQAGPAPRGRRLCRPRLRRPEHGIKGRLSGGSCRVLAAGRSLSGPSGPSRFHRRPRVIPDLSVLWVIVLVLALTFVVQRFLFGPLLHVMHERESATAKAQALAAEAGRRAQAATADYDAQMSAARNEVYRQMETVRRGALDRSAAFVAQARQDAEATRADALRSLDASVAAARTTLATDAEALSHAIVDRVLERRVS